MGSSPFIRTRLGPERNALRAFFFFILHEYSALKRVSFLQRKPSREPRRASRVRGFCFITALLSRFWRISFLLTLPCRDKLCIACSDLFYKPERAHTPPRLFFKPSPPLGAGLPPGRKPKSPWQAKRPYPYKRAGASVCTVRPPFLLLLRSGPHRPEAGMLSVIPAPTLGTTWE